MQSRALSLVEAAANVAVGYTVAVAANLLVLPAFGYAVSLRDASAMGLVFTLISLVRSYVLRRLFNSLASGASLPCRQSQEVA